MKNRVIAILLCWLVGWCGAHKFYLGENGWGVLYFVFCWTGIPFLAAFIEFLSLAFMSEADFNTRFNRHLMPQTAYHVGPVSATDATHALADLKKLYDQGIITAEEYEEKRQNLLRSL